MQKIGAGAWARLCDGSRQKHTNEEAFGLGGKQNGTLASKVAMVGNN
jgi:hypothetical protein